MPSPLSQILLLGVGNILLRDEGTGVHVLHQLEESYQFSSNVTLLDGGTLGIHLMNPIAQCDHLILIDVARMGAAAGTIYSLTLDDFHARVRPKNSVHQINLLETLGYIRMTGDLPKTNIVGIEPENWTDWGTTMTETVRAQLEALKAAVLTEVKAAGGSYTLKKESSKAS